MALFPDSCNFTLSRTGRIRQITLGDCRIATVRAADGRLTLGREGAIRLHGALVAPAYRVVVSEEVASVIAEGGNVFARHVVSADPAIRPGDEVLVVNNRDQLIASGISVLPGPGMTDFKYGVAVKVRYGSE